MKLNVEGLVNKKTDSLVQKIEFKSGVFFNLKYISRAELQTLSRSCQEFKFNDKTKTRELALDGVKFAKEFARKAVVGWEGLTVNTLATIIPLNTEKVETEKRDEQIEFDHALLDLMLENAYELDAFLQEHAIDLKYFQPHKEESEKNSKPSQSGS